MAKIEAKLTWHHCEGKIIWFKPQKKKELKGIDSS